MLKQIIHEALDQPRWLYPIALVAIVGCSLGVYRLIAGLGPTTNLSDGYPWGLWIGFDLFMIALSGGAFTLATFVYIFHLEELRPAMRVTILTGLLGYLSVMVILMMDLGRWDRFYHFFFYPNFNSALFEIAVCIMSYSLVLIAEFSPVALEKIGNVRLLAIIRRYTIPLVILGTTLSTMHQSSLGTLFVIMSQRVHPLWYSAIQPILFFVSSVGAGISTVIAVTTLSYILFRRALNQAIIAEIGSFLPWVLAFYWAVRLGELIAVGDLGLLFQFDNYTLLYLTEFAVLGVIPIVLFALERARQDRRLAVIGALVTLSGVFLNRFDMAWFALAPVEGFTYIPSWIEVAIQLGVICAVLVVWVLLARYLPLFEDPHHGFHAELLPPKPASTSFAWARMNTLLKRE